MTKPTIRIHNVETDEVIDREMTDAEFAAYEAQQVKDKAFVAAQVAAEIAKKAAESKLAALGLTADDLKALGL